MGATPSHTPKERLDRLQVLRAVAAGMVVYAHGLTNWQTKGTDHSPLSPLVDLGHIGVVLFFGLSGFIIVHTSFGLPSGWRSALDFMRRRFLRITPLYWLATLVYSVRLAISGKTFDVADYLRSLAYIPYQNPDGLIQPILGVGWSLNHEMFFYGLFGALLLLPRKWHSPALISCLVALTAARMWGALPPTLANGSDNALYHWVHPIVLYFVSGMLIAHLARCWKARGWPRPSGIGSTISIGVAMGMCMSSPLWGPDWVEPLSAIGGMLAITLCVIAQPVEGPRGWLWRGLVRAGDASYSTYLTHGFMMGPLAVLIAQTGAPLSQAMFAGLSVLLCTLGGIVIYLRVERPLTQKVSALTS